MKPIECQDFQVVVASNDMLKTLSGAAWVMVIITCVVMIASAVYTAWKLRNTDKILLDALNNSKAE